MNDKIMMNYNLTIARGVNIELDRIRSQLESSEERGDRILGNILMGSAVGDRERFSGGGQLDLVRVA